MTALRLFEAGSFAFGPLAWTRTGGGAWQPFALGGGRRTDASLHRAAGAGGRAARVLQPDRRAGRRAPASSPGRCGASSWAASGRARPRR